MLRESVTSEAAHENEGFTKEESNEESCNQDLTNAVERENAKENEEIRQERNPKDENKDTKSIQNTSNFLEVKNLEQV